MVRGPLNWELSTAPNSKVPLAFILKLQAITGVPRLPWRLSINVGFLSGRTVGKSRPALLTLLFDLGLVMGYKMLDS